MPSRALIVVIENYPASNGEVAPKIDGAIAAGQQFGDWLLSRKGLQAANLFVCSDGGTYDPAVNRFGTEREHILDAVSALVRAGQDSTDEFFFFYSGHGLMFADNPQRRAVSIVLAADFVSAADSGTKCINLGELQTKLWAILGGRNHYYFIDACRTILNEGDIEPVPFGRTLGRPAQRGKPTIYTLYSTKFGEAAEIQSPFSSALLDGLTGKGRAKGYVGPDLYVLFPLLAGYVASHMGDQKIDEAKDGSGDGLILQISPVPQYAGSVTIEGAAADDHFVLRRAPVGQPQFLRDYPFAGATFSFSYTPVDATLDVFENGQPLERVDPPASESLDFFDTFKATFRRPSQKPAYSPAVGFGGLAKLTAPASILNEQFDSRLSSAVRLTNLQSLSSVLLSARNPSASLAAGRWQLAITEHGSAIAKTMVDVLPGSDGTLELPPIAPDPIRAAIIAAIPGSENTGPTIDFSESLGPTADPDLGLWLTIMGAAHIFNGHIFEKLSGLALASFEDLPASGCATYILSALPHEGGVKVAVGNDWQSLQTLANISTVLHATLPATSGLGDLSFAIGNHEIRTVTTLHLPNLVTLVVLFNDTDGRLTFAQLLLPVQSALTHLPTEMQHWQDHTFLSQVRSMYTFQSLFSRKRLLDPPEVQRKEADTTKPGNPMKVYLDALLQGEWLDPIASLIVCYDTLRREDASRRDSITRVVLPGLQRLFPEIPDVSALAQLLNPSEKVAVPPQQPIFTEGIFAFPDWPELFPHESARLDYKALWTTWVGATA